MLLHNSGSRSAVDKAISNLTYYNQLAYRFRYPHKMKTSEIEKKHTNFEKLFGFYVLWFRLICVPIKSHKPSRVYTLYSTLLTLNTYSVFLTILADLFQHSVGLEHIMENFRVIFPVLSAIWVQITMR
jgi:hypothetical protein